MRKLLIALGLSTALLATPTYATPDQDRIKEGVKTAAFCTATYISISALMRIAVEKAPPSEKPGYQKQAEIVTKKAAAMEGFIFKGIILSVAKTKGLDPAAMIALYDAQQRATLNDYQKKMAAATNPEIIGALLAESEHNCDEFAKAIVGSDPAEPDNQKAPVSPNKGPV